MMIKPQVFTVKEIQARARDYAEYNYAVGNKVLFTLRPDWKMHESMSLLVGWNQ